MRSTSMWLCVMGLTSGTLIAANTASAATLLAYDASSGLRPNELPSGAWSKSGLDMTIAGGKLTQHASDGGAAGAPSQEYLSPALPAGTFKLATPSSINNTEYGIEFRVQPQTDTAFVGGAWPRAYLFWSDNVQSYNITVDKFSDNATSGTGSIVYGQASFSPAITGIDWTVPHTIYVGQRAGADPNDGLTTSLFDFYLDGVLQSTRSAGSMGRSAGFPYAQDRIDFGDGTTGSNAVTADWYSVRVFDSAAPAAVPEPASVTLLGLGGAAVLARRRR